MRTIPYFDSELTVEEYIKKEICKNTGTQSVAFKDNLKVACDSMGIPYEEKLKKKELFDLLIENGCGYERLAELFGVGVSSQIYQKAFGITHQQVKKLENKGIIRVVGNYRFRAFGKYLYAPLYDVYQYATITAEEVYKYIKY